MSEQKKFFSSVGYVVLFVFAFLFFVFMSFPYNALKELVVAKISAETGLNIRIKEFGPALPLGFYAEEVSVSPAEGGASLEFERAKVTLAIFRLFIGEVAADIYLGTANDGELDAQASWRVFSFFSNDMPMPRKIWLEADKFDLSNSANFLLKVYAKQANDLIKGVFAQMSLKGLLDGDMTLVMSAADPVQSSGEVNLQINNGVLDLNDPNLNIPPQNFSKALIRANLRGGRLVLDNDSGLVAEELAIGIRGSTSLRHPFDRSLLDIDISLQLQGSLQDNFGFLLSMMGGGGSEETASYKLSGTMGRPAFNPL
ncbi:MAG: type II secretion system protein GspN [Oligoflexus sp.]